MSQSVELRRQALMALTEMYSDAGMTIRWLEQLEQASRVENVPVDAGDPDYANTLAHRAREHARLYEQSAGALTRCWPTPACRPAPRPAAPDPDRQAVPR